MAFYVQHTGFRPLHLFNVEQQSLELARILRCYDRNNVVPKNLVWSTRLVIFLQAPTFYGSGRWHMTHSRCMGNKKYRIKYVVFWFCLSGACPCPC